MPTELLVVYREYDCLDALARAPTPLPPMCLDNEETDSELDPADTEAVQSQGSSNTITPTYSAPVGRTAPYQRPGTTSTGAPVPQTPKSIHRFTIDLLNRPPQSKATARSEANESSSHDINAVSRFEATVGGSEQANAVEMLHRSYELCDGPAPAKRKSSSVQMPDTPPDNPVKGASGIKNTSPASTISTLSPVPFNLSAQDEDRDTTVGFCNHSHDSGANDSRLKASLLHMTFQVYPVPHPRLRHQGREVNRLAARPKKSQSVIGEELLLAILAFQSERRTA